MLCVEFFFPNTFSAVCEPTLPHDVAGSLAIENVLSTFVRCPLKCHSILRRNFTIITEIQASITLMFTRYMYQTYYGSGLTPLSVKLFLRRLAIKQH